MRIEKGKKMADENILLNVAGLSAAVDEKVILHDVDLTVGTGETHVLMGPNGAGKSTLGHVVMGDPEYTVTGGKITFNGQDITDLSTDKRSHAGLFLSFQAPVEIPGVPVSSFLRAISAGRPGVGDMKGKQFRKHVKELAEELNMDPAYLDRELGVGFSGGEKKKLEMLQLLLLEPKLARGHWRDPCADGPERRRQIDAGPRGHGRSRVHGDRRQNHVQRTGYHRSVHR